MGGVVRAEIEVGIEGIEVISVLPPKAPRTDDAEAQRIEVVGTVKSTPDVSVTLAPGSKRRRDGDDRPGRGDDRSRGRGRAGAPRRDGPRSSGEPGGEGAERRVAGRPGPGRSTAGRRSGAEGSPGERSGRSGPEREGSGRGRDEREAGRRDRRPAVSTAHRNAALAALRPEQLPIAEQLVRGGIPAVRQAIDEQNARARSEGQQPASAEPIMAMAEELLPVVTLATWKDRAMSAQQAGRELRLRELRAVVAASRTVSLDEEGRALAKTLQESLDSRVNALRDEWVARITNALDEHRVADALRAVARPPEPATRCPAELAVRLAESAGAAMSAETPPEQWLSLLEAVVESPVRRTVHPSGIPSDPAVQAAARNAAGLVPQLAKLLGLRIPPPPPRRMTTRRPPLSEASGAGPLSAP